MYIILKKPSLDSNPFKVFALISTPLLATFLKNSIWGHNISFFSSNALLLPFSSHLYTCHSTEVALAKGTKDLCIIQSNGQLSVIHLSVIHFDQSESFDTVDHCYLKIISVLDLRKPTLFFSIPHWMPLLSFLWYFLYISHIFKHWNIAKLSLLG